MRNIRQLAQFDLNLLVIFRLLDETRHVTKAAKLLGVTQPTFSHALKRLRAVFNDPLFVKSSSGMVLTPVAEAISEPVRQVLDQLERDLIDRGSFNLKTLDRIFKIKTTDLVENLILPPLIQKFEKDAPKAKVSFQTTGFDLPQAELERGVVDIAIAGFFGELPVGFYQQALFSEGYLCAIRKDHPRLGEKKKLSLDEYCRETHILIAPGGELTGKVDAVLKRQKISRSIIAGVSGFMISGFVVSKTDSILTAPESLLKQFSHYFPVKTFALPIAVPDFKVVQVWHERNHLDPGHQWLRGFIKSVFK